MKCMHILSILSFTIIIWFWDWKEMLQKYKIMKLWNTREYVKQKVPGIQ